MPHSATPHDEANYWVEVGSRIRVTRELYRLTQDDVAQALACEPSTIARYERGERAPTSEHVLRIALSAQTSPDWILCGYIDQLMPTLQTLIMNAAPQLVHQRFRAFAAMPPAEGSGGAEPPVHNSPALNLPHRTRRKSSRPTSEHME